MEVSETLLREKTCLETLRFLPSKVKGCRRPAQTWGGAYHPQERLAGVDIREKKKSFSQNPATRKEVAAKIKPMGGLEGNNIK